MPDGTTVISFHSLNFNKFTWERAVAERLRRPVALRNTSGGGARQPREFLVEGSVLIEPPTHDSLNTIPEFKLNFNAFALPWIAFGIYNKCHSTI